MTSGYCGIDVGTRLFAICSNDLDEIQNKIFKFAADKELGDSVSCEEDAETLQII